MILSLRALIRGIRERSLLFSLMFAMAVMGGSLAGLLRDPLRAAGLWWPLAFLLPIFIFKKTAAWETRWLGGLRIRSIGSALLIAGSILLSVLLWRYEGALEERYADSFVRGPLFKESSPIDRTRRGPRGRP